MHRLLAFANRELSVLMCNAQADLLTAFDVLQELILDVNLKSQEFNLTLSSFLGTKTNHFVHELINFARSPYDDMISYECNVRYQQRPIEIIENPVGEAEGEKESQQEQVKQPPKLPRQLPLNNTKLIHNFVEFSKSVDEDECVGFLADLETEDEEPDEIEDLLDMADLNLNTPLLMELRRMIVERNAGSVRRGGQTGGQLTNDLVLQSSIPAGTGAAAAAGGGSAAATPAIGGTFDMNTNSVIRDFSSISTSNNNSNVAAAAAAQDAGAAAAGTSSNLLGNDLSLEVAIERSMLDRMEPDYFMPRRGQPLLPTTGYPRNPPRPIRPTDPNSGAAAIAASAASIPRSLRSSVRSSTRSRGSSVVPKRRRTTPRDAEH